MACERCGVGLCAACLVTAARAEQEYEDSVVRCLERDMDGTFWAYGYLYPLGDAVQGWGVWLARAAGYEADTNVQNWTNDYTTFEGAADEEGARVLAVRLNNGEGEPA